MSRILKFILFLVFFLVFFEAGLVSSYTIVTSEPPDIEKLIDFQFNAISSLLNFEGLNSTFAPTPESFNITNPTEVAEALKSRGKLDGINLESMSATTFADTNSDNFQINITATGYKESVTGGNKTGGAIVIAPNETYSIKATAVASMKEKGIEININTIQIVSIGRLYTNNVTNG
ncbi:MAG: hypothetical protein ACP5C3_08410 [Methanomicrobiales archaeon]